MRFLPAVAIVLHFRLPESIQCLVIPTPKKAFTSSPPTPRRHVSFTLRRTGSVRLLMSSTEKSAESIDNCSDVLEDADGIGQLTVDAQETPSTTMTGSLSSAEKEDIIDAGTQDPEVDILSSIDDAQLMNPDTVVEQVIGTLSNPTPNGALQESIPALTQSQSPLQSEQHLQPIEAPTLRKILNFAVPAIGVWLCSPLLSLIDTSSVGLLSGTAQQAALNPAVAVTDYGGLLVAFMYTATTNLVASVQEKEKGEPTKPKTAQTLVQAMQISVYVGVALGGALIALARPLLRSIIGNDAIDPVVFAAAMRYVRIRALGMPAAVVIGSAQSACLGMKDVRSPLYVLFAAAVVNFFGDVLFVGRKSAWVGGAAGAAWATVFSQYAALTMFIRWLTTVGKGKKTSTTSLNKKDTVIEKVDLTNPILELMGECEIGESRRMRLRKSLKSFRSSVVKSPDSPMPNTSNTPPGTRSARASSAQSTSDQPFSTRGFLAGRFSVRKLFQFPTRNDAKVFQPYFIPVTTTQVGRVSSYIAMSHVVSSALGTASMAANQIIVSFFYCLTPVADSLNLTAQSFVPGIFEKKKSEERSAALKKTMVNFMKAGLIFGGIMSSMVGMMTKLGKFFSSDASVLAEVATAVPMMVGIFSVHGFICAGEGLLLGQKDLGFLGKAYALYFFVVPYFMLRVKKAALSGAANIGLKSVWKVFLAYQLVRITLWIARLSQLQHRTEKALVVEEDLDQ